MCHYAANERIVMKYLYVSTSAYPGNSAYATRIEGICNALQSDGNEITVLTDCSATGIEVQYLNGFRILSSAKHKYQERTLSDKLLAYSRMLRRLKKLLNEEHFDCVITSSIYIRIRPVMGIIRKHNIPIVLESCEWFDTYNWKRGSKSLEYRMFIKAWNEDFVKADGVIAISRMLENRYAEHNLPALRLPTIMDVKNTPYSLETSNEKIHLIFVGSISWGKDRVAEVIEAMQRLGNDQVELHIYGPSMDAVRAQLADDTLLDKMQNTVFIHGSVPHGQIALKCREADYGILLRPDRRQSHAGFPTKLAEYMSAGTPVIANNTGDVGLYMPRELLLDTQYTVEDVVKLLQYLLQLDPESRRKLRQQARNTALQCFDYRSNTAGLNQFIRDVCEQYIHQH